MGHVSPRPLRVLGPGGHLQGREHRGAPGEGDLLIVGSAGRRPLGAHGEEAAAGWYRSRGYEIVARNWRNHQGEIDLIARLGSTLVFCEVKTRSGDAFGQPYEAVTRTKQMRIRRLAAAWLAEQGRHARFDLRFDVASVRAGRVEVIEAAF